MFTIPEEHKHVFKAVAYMIERKLLDMQMDIIAHRSKMRYVSFEYADDIAEEYLKKMEQAINTMYNELEIFCTQYGVPKQHISFKNELAIKANFLWEDITSANSKSMRGYGKLEGAVITDYEKKINEMIATVNQLIQTCELKI
ncbi:MAG: hypothetical protein ACR2FN_14740 [Chitinophagaceae bacterium]